MFFFPIVLALNLMGKFLWLCGMQDLSSLMTPDQTLTLLQWKCPEVLSTEPPEKSQENLDILHGFTGAKILQSNFCA